MGQSRVDLFPLYVICEMEPPFSSRHRRDIFDVDLAPVPGPRTIEVDKARVMQLYCCSQRIYIQNLHRCPNRKDEHCCLCHSKGSWELEIN